jgi:tRNA threonylcarbamoyladenosine biosynthesis protein TsaE
VNSLADLRVLAQSPDETRQIAGSLAGVARDGDVILLIGEMGSGKTVFAQGFGQELGVDEPITSPTFTLVHSYDTGRMALHHADLYRLDLQSEVADLALSELVEGDGILLVEWGEAAADIVGDHLEVSFERVGESDSATVDGDSQRWLTIRPVGSAWNSRWSRLETALAPWQKVA